MELFYDHYQQHQAFIETTLTKILKLNPNHQLTILHFIDLSLRKKDFSSIKHWVDHCLTLTDIPVQELIQKLDLAFELIILEYQSAKFTTYKMILKLTLL